MKRKIGASIFLILACVTLAVAAETNEFRQYKVLATNKTSTMEKELNEAAAAGFTFDSTVGGESAFGGKEVVVIMSKTKSSPAGKMEYKLLATNKTGTMQKELQEAGSGGYQYKGQTVFQTTFGGKEVVVILERERDAPHKRFEYRLLATNKTATMQQELLAVSDLGFVLVGVTVAETAFGGKEVVSIVHKEVGK